MVVSQMLGRILTVETNIFRKFIQFSSKQICFLQALPTWVHGKGLYPLQPPMPLPAASQAQRVNKTFVDI